MESAQELAEPLSPHGAADSRPEPAPGKAPLWFSGLKLKHRAVSVNWGFFFVSVLTMRALLLVFLLGPLFLETPMYLVVEASSVEHCSYIVEPRKKNTAA